MWCSLWSVCGLQFVPNFGSVVLVSSDLKIFIPLLFLIFYFCIPPYFRVSNDTSSSRMIFLHVSLMQMSPSLCEFCESVFFPWFWKTSSHSCAHHFSAKDSKGPWDPVCKSLELLLPACSYFLSKFSLLFSQFNKTPARFYSSPCTVV